ncbi:MAG: hypothetical protein NC123_14160 [Butyrivibrio sp.]|nr:hypothetical protein [Acetatifactor muris]MCM1560666.1 hypothetical protein [Butyrivibrio sp.]
MIPTLTADNGQAASDRNADTAGMENESETEKNTETAAAFQYIELTEIEDFYGDNSMYEVYAPMGNSNEDGNIFYYGHGLTYNACVYGYGFELNEYLLEALESWTAFETEGWLDDNSEYTDVEISRVLQNGKDLYQVVTAKKEDLFGTPYEVNLIYYMNDVDLDVIKADGGWAAATEDRLRQELALEEGPYTLDWNMTLQKSW